ncbi:hypothetical protein [Clostridium sp. CF012]|nr:hypothetical protein [Clostridium sp. CF012]MBU3146922.1 hypothetical protein [Clostridium sp. CF012]
MLSLIEDIKPAHLMLSYIFAYLLVGDIKAMTVGELRTKTIKEFAFNAI